MKISFVLPILILGLSFNPAIALTTEGTPINVKDCTNPNILGYVINQKLGKGEYGASGNWMSHHAIIKSKRSLPQGYDMFMFYIRFEKTIKMKNSSGFDIDVDVWHECSDKEMAELKK